MQTLVHRLDRLADRLALAAVPMAPILAVGFFVIQGIRW